MDIHSISKKRRAYRSESIVLALEMFGRFVPPDRRNIGRDAHTNFICIVVKSIKHYYYAPVPVLYEKKGLKYKKRHRQKLSIRLLFGRYGISLL